MWSDGSRLKSRAKVPSPLKRTVSPKSPRNPEIIYAYLLAIAPLFIAPLYRFPLVVLASYARMLAPREQSLHPPPARGPRQVRRSSGKREIGAVRTRPPPFAHCILPLAAYLPEPLVIPLARVYHSRRRVCGRDRTMCPRAVRSTEWVRQTRNIIASMAGEQAAVAHYGLFSFPFRSAVAVGCP